MLKVTGDGKKLALDPRCIDPLLSDESGSKLNYCADKMCIRDRICLFCIRTATV